MYFGYFFTDATADGELEIVLCSGLKVITPLNLKNFNSSFGDLYSRLNKYTIAMHSYSCHDLASDVLN